MYGIRFAPRPGNLAVTAPLRSFLLALLRLLFFLSLGRDGFQEEGDLRGMPAVLADRHSLRALGAADDEIELEFGVGAGLHLEVDAVGAAGGGDLPGHLIAGV